MAVAAALCLGLAQAASAQVKLELKWPENTKQSMTTTRTIDQTMTIMGMEIDTRNEQSVGTTRSIGAKRSDGTTPVEFVTDSFKSTMTHSIVGTVSFDSADPDAGKDDTSPLAFLRDIYKLLAGSSYTVVVGADGKIVNVEGTEKLLEKAGDLSPEAADVLRGELDSQKLKANLNEEYGFLPKTLVRPGDTWTGTNRQDIGGGQTFTYDTTYEYKGTIERDGKTLDKIDKKATAVKYTQDAAAATQAKAEDKGLKIESSEGTILLDRATGTIVDSKDKTRIVGKMTLTVMGQELDTDLDLTWEESTVVNPK
jgi:hypothetical protein